MDDDDPGIAPSQLYAWAALTEGIPFINGAPNLTVDIPAMNELSRKMNAPICRTGLQDGADADQERSGAGVQGAHAGRERLVLDQHPGQPGRRGAGRTTSFKTKEESKLGLLEMILQPDAVPRPLQRHLPQDTH